VRRRLNTDSGLALNSVAANEVSRAFLCREDSGFERSIYLPPYHAVFTEQALAAKLRELITEN
jgi:hypothetical protein